MRRDIEQTRRLEDIGWRVCHFWEHEIFQDPQGIVISVVAAMRSRRWIPPRSWRVYRVVEIDPARRRERREMCELRNPTRLRANVRKRSTRKWATAVLVAGLEVDGY